DLERRIRLEVTQRIEERRTAGARVSLAERSLESARLNHKVAADRYREGVIPSSELLDAEVGLLRAALDRTSAQAALRVAEAALQRATGR
ncbi:MAG TPA: TolC family protein, partial [Vicinamibacteria bacterium]|nr:TolC family protein [Vicinamibacteria bacterium]